ncbi:MAG TPA: hypothetical protein VGY54_26895, partial [Polyangiaceae bacterium]|nr:hypothetical protein [Polyangiaceae bacterium]
MDRIELEARVAPAANPNAPVLRDLEDKELYAPALPATRFSAHLDVEKTSLLVKNPQFVGQVRGRAVRVTLQAKYRGEDTPVKVRVPLEARHEHGPSVDSHAQDDSPVVLSSAHPNQIVRDMGP